ncbi:MAG TPA: hypothetical protein PK271_14255, partial [Hyphomicrobium sp.]|uniref:hypothetical protein n=1 Tax=Hyphomicrobium sp. TaxID=82 RepID=UPI002CD7F760
MGPLISRHKVSSADGRALYTRQQEKVDHDMGIFAKGDTSALPFALGRYALLLAHRVHEAGEQVVAVLRT